MDASVVPQEEPRPRVAPSFADAFRFWLRLGFISFGGPAGQIATLHKEVVEKRRWMSEERFTSGLAFCTFLPGPEAQQLATYIGWSLHGVRGGLAAGILFFLPASVILLGLSIIRAKYGSMPLVSAVLYGLRPVVVALIAEAVLRMARTRLKSRASALVAGFAFVAAFWLRVPFPWVVLTSALGGLIFPSREQREPIVSSGDTAFSLRAELRRLTTITAAGASLWAAPWIVMRSAGSAAQSFVDQYLFFTKAAFVTFGGAYAVLSYVTHAAVTQFGWLTRAEVMDGLALAETTPGPLIIVLQYVGFFAAWNDPQDLPRGLSGTIGSVVATYATFLPSLVLVFLGAPYVERLRSYRRLSAGIGAIGIAVVGVIAALGLDYCVAAIFPSGIGVPDLFAMFILVVAFATLRRGVPLGLVLLGGAVAGLLRSLSS